VTRRVAHRSAVVRGKAAVQGEFTPSPAPSPLSIRHPRAYKARSITPNRATLRLSRNCWVGGGILTPQAGNGTIIAMSNTPNDMQWKLLCTACCKDVDYFNVANLHCDWTGGEQTDKARRLWYSHLSSAVDSKYLTAYIDVYTQSRTDPDLYQASFVPVPQVDFRRRMHFRATPKAWAAYHAQLKGGRKRPKYAADGGCWVVEDLRTGRTWKEDLHGKKIN